MTTISSPFRHLLLFSVFAIIVQPGSGNDWPRFRGPNGNGIVPEIQHPMSWSETKNIAWKYDLPGGGLSSPIAVGSKVVITSVNGADLPKNFAGGVSNMRPMRPGGPVKFMVTCLNLETGKKEWEKTLANERPAHPIHSSNSFATETPASDGKHFFVYFASIGKLFALDMNGNQLWEKEIGSFPTGNGFGPGSSIAVNEDSVFVQCDNDKQSFVIALDSKSGEQKWKKSRESRTSWSTPVLWKNKNRVELITCGSGFVTSYDPNSGNENWTLTGISSSFSASPATDSQRIYFGNSGPRSSGPLVAVNAQMSGKMDLGDDQAEGKVIWSRQRSGPGMSSPVVVDGLLYVPGRGMLSCYRADTGDQVYKERLPLKSTASSMWGSKQAIFLIDEAGKCIAIKPGEKFEVLETNEIDDQFWSSPSVAGKSLLLRGLKTLYCVRQK